MYMDKNDIKLVINKMTVTRNRLDLLVAISCPYDENVIAPRVKINFKYKNHTRRLPFAVVNYFKQKQGDKCIIICKYRFNLDFVFYNYTCNGKIGACFDFYYGDYYVEKVPFCISENVLHQNPALELDEQFVERESIDGATVYSSSDEEIHVKEAYGENTYGFEIDCPNSELRFFITEKAKKNFVHTSVLLVPIIRFLLFVLRVCFAIVLIPYFIVDGFFAGLDIIPRRKSKQIKGVFKNIIVQIKLNFSSFLKMSLKKENVVAALRKSVVNLVKIYYNLQKKKPLVENRIAFMSCRRDELSGNPAFVYNLIKDDKDIDFRFLLYSNAKGYMDIKNIIKFFKLYATSKVVVVDDYFRLLNLVDKRDGVKVIQLWHACGAFKTFGFSRLGKHGGPRQTDCNHRMYDYAIVSSEEIAKYYAEGFGLNDENVVATGIPRTDIFMDEQYKSKVVSSFYSRYPKLKDKKIMLFAPTFRGSGQVNAYYPADIINIKALYEELGGKYAIIIKLHPFCKEKISIPQEYSDYIIDLSSADELNDLLFVTDLLVTDYSSVVFEASLLSIPMLFYAFDLYDYISNRDFYYNFETFVPGKIVFNEHELIESVKNQDFEAEKIDGFKNKFFDHLDGRSSQRVADLILNELRGKES